MTKSISTSIKNSSQKGKKLLAILLNLYKTSTSEISLIVDERIRNKEQLDNAYNNGIDVVITRTAFENNTIN